MEEGVWQKVVKNKSEHVRWVLDWFVQLWRDAPDLSVTTHHSWVLRRGYHLPVSLIAQRESLCGTCSWPEPQIVKVYHLAC